MELVELVILSRTENANKTVKRSYQSGLFLSVCLCRDKNKCLLRLQQHNFKTSLAIFKKEMLQVRNVCGVFDAAIKSVTDRGKH